MSLTASVASDARRWRLLSPYTAAFAIVLAVGHVAARVWTTAEAPAVPAPSAEPSSPSPGALWTSPVDGRAMVRIGAGEFLMGSPPSEIDRRDEEILHPYPIAHAFWLDIMEVDNAAYRRFLRAQPAWEKNAVRRDARLDNGHYLEHWGGAEFPPGKDNHPVVNVPWAAARAYCEWAGKRLPTEPESEYAARAGTTTRYWWGDAFDPVHANNRLHTEPVGHPRRRNPWGLYDMIGNVWEWTESKDMLYPYRPADGREDPDASGERSIRGGSWFLAPAYLRAAFRGWSDPVVSSDLVGFRCAA